MTSRVLTVAAVVCALAIGGLFAGIADRAEGRAPAAKTAGQAGAQDAHAAPPSERPMPAIAPRPARPSAPALPPALPAQDPVDPVAIERDLAEQDALLAHAFDTAPANAAWADTASATLTAALDGFAAQAPFRATKVECRGAMCRAQVEGLDAHDDVMSWGGRLIGADYGLGCSTRIRFAPPSADGGPQTGTLYLTDCGRGH